MTRSTDDLRAEIRALAEELRARMRSDWQRDLPLEELLSDRWERAASLGFGAGASIYAASYVYGDVSVGEGTWIGPMTLLDGSGGGLTIGAHCSISAGVQIYTHDTVRRALSGGVADIERAPVSIGDSCHIGALTVIARGVTIGHHCVVGASSFVNRDLEPYTLAVGAPCRAIGRVEVDVTGELRLVHLADGGTR